MRVRLASAVTASLVVAVSLACSGGRRLSDQQSSDAVSQGERLYRAHGCVVCHGATGRGDGPAAVTLNPGPRDFRDVASYRQGTGNSDISETLRTGVLSATRQQMPAYGHLSEGDRRALAAFVVSLRAAH